MKMVIVPLTSVGLLKFGSIEKDIIHVLGEPSRRIEVKIPIPIIRLEYVSLNLHCYVENSFGLFSVGIGREENRYSLFGQDLFSERLLEQLKEQGIVFEVSHDSFEVTTKRAVALGIDFNFEDSKILFIHCYAPQFWSKCKSSGAALV